MARGAAMAEAARPGAVDGAANGAANGGVRLLLRAEGVALLAIAVAAYARFGGEWSFFAATFMLPALALSAYLVGPRAGALAYNAAHSLIVPAGLLALGLALDGSVLFDLGLAWAAHIGLARALGFGLKYSRGFAHTHLGQLGPADPW